MSRSRRNIIFTFFLLLSMGTIEATSDRRVVRSAAEYRRRRCRSVAQTSALLLGNERPLLRTFAVGLTL